MFYLYPVATRLASRAGLTGQCNVRRRYTLSEKHGHVHFFVPGLKEKMKCERKNMDTASGRELSVRESGSPDPLVFTLSFLLM